MKEQRPEEAWARMARSPEQGHSQRAREQLREEESPDFPQFFGELLREPWQSHQGRLSERKVRLAGPGHRPLQQEAVSLLAQALLGAASLRVQALLRAVAPAQAREQGQAWTLAVRKPERVHSSSQASGRFAAFADAALRGPSRWRRSRFGQLPQGRPEFVEKGPLVIFGASPRGL